MANFLWFMENSKMPKNIDCGKETVLTTTACYEKELVWEIENFTNWWSSREVANSNSGEKATEFEETTNVEHTKDWNMSSKSPLLKFEIEGVEHEFQLALLKYDSYDQFDDKHNLMMGVSLLYNGPSEFLIMKPLFYLNELGKGFRNPLNAKILKKGMFSEAKVFSHHSLTLDEHRFIKENFVVMCTAQVYVIKEVPETLSLYKGDVTKKTWNRCLLDDFNFCSTDENGFQQFSDFEIVCVDRTRHGDKIGRRFRCHKLVLYLGSRYYKKMFSGNFSEKEGMVRVTDIPGDTMAKLLQYLYTGRIENKEIDVDLLMAADKYEIESLHACCESELAANISLETAPELAAMANLCGSETFKNYVFRFVGKHWKQFKGMETSELVRNSAETLSQILDEL